MQVQVFLNVLSCRVIRVLWLDKILNQELRRRTNYIHVDMRIRTRKWQWTGHTLRRNDNPIAGYAIDTSTIRKPAWLMR